MEGYQYVMIVAMEITRVSIAHYVKWIISNLHVELRLLSICFLVIGRQELNLQKVVIQELGFIESFVVSF